MSVFSIKTSSWHYKLVKAKVNSYRGTEISLLQYISWVIARLVIGISLFSAFAFFSILVGSNTIDVSIPPDKIFRQDFWFLLRCFVIGGINMTLTAFAAVVMFCIIFHSEVFSKSKWKVSFDDTETRSDKK